MKDHVNAAVESLRAKGVRMTPQRQAVMERLFFTPAHATASQVFSALSKTLPTLSLSTVYDTLEMLRREGILEVICPFCDRRRYFLADDSHFHVACVKCQRIEDLPADCLRLSEEQLSQISHSSGYWIDKARSIFFGRCPRCR